MPTKRLALRKVKEVLRLRWECGLSYRQIARSCAVARAAQQSRIMSSGPRPRA